MTLDRAQVWQAIDAHRIRFHDLLAGLGDHAWGQPSLCSGWTVKDVVAHLSYQRLDLGPALAAAVRARGRIDRIVHDLACRRAAAESPTRLLSRLRALEGHRVHPPGVTYREALIDHLVHSQDITVALGIDFPLDPAAATAAVERIWAEPLAHRAAPFHPRRRVRGHRLRASDVDWSAGDGVLIEAPIGVLLLLLSGRPVRPDQLHGTGSAGLAHR